MTELLTRGQIAAAKPTVRSSKGSARLAWVSFTQVLLNPFNIGFALALPILMYLMFGANQDYSDYPVGNGNIAAQILLTMALFGVLMTTSSFATSVSLERTQGIGRLYALTPLSASAQLASRAVAIMGVTAIVIMVVFLVGFATGASMSLTTWMLSWMMVMAVSVIGILIGLGCGFAIRADGAGAASSAIVVLSAFGAGLTIPLEQLGQFFQDLAPWTPLWGAGRLVSLPLLGWDTFTWNMLINLLVWCGLFAAMAVWGIRRDTGR